jgi:adenosylhomocysteine nucleosidase
VILANEVRNGRYETLHTTSQWREALQARLRRRVAMRVAPIAAVDDIVKNASEKTKLRYQTDAIAADMESLAVLRAAQDAGLPAIVVRAVSDPSQQNLPDFVTDAIDAKGQLAPWKVLKSLILNPRQLWQMRDLAGSSKAATKTLVRVCELAGPDFALPDFRRVLIRQLREVSSFRR